MKMTFTSGMLLTVLATLVQAGEPDVTYARDIAPMMNQNCVECHRPQQTAPFALQTYDQVRKRSRTIAAVIESGFMPPWQAEGGDVPLHGERRLTPAQVRLFKAWVTAGMPEGNESDLPPAPEFKSGWRLGEPDLVLEMSDAYVLPATGPDIYRNFVVPTGLEKARWLKAIEFRPDTPAVVHHSLFYLDTTGAARKADAREEDPGFAEMPLGQGIGKFLGGWVPGTHPLPLPEGLAHRLPAGADIVLSSHFHLTAKEEQERSTIALYFGDEAPTREFFGLQLPPVFGAFAGLDIPAGEAKAHYRDSFELPVDVEAFGATAHAHYIGKSLRLTAKLPSGKDLVLLNLPDWDISWQEEYRFVEPVILPAGTRLISDIVWDNSADNPNNPFSPPKRIHWGLESNDEMGSLTLMISGQRGSDMKRLRERYSEHLRWQVGHHVLGPGKLEFADNLRKSALERFDTDGDGELNPEERSKARAFLKRND